VTGDIVAAGPTRRRSATKLGPPAGDILAALPRRIHLAMTAQVARHADRIALVDDQGSLTYSALQSAATSTAARLSSLGIRAGDRIMVVSENCNQMAVLLLAASMLDAWTIVANPRLSPRELDQIRDHSGSRRMLLTAARSPEAASHAERYGAPMIDIPGLGDIAVTGLNEPTDPEPVHADPARQVAVLIYTSGTTGMPKGVMLTHENLLFSAQTTALIRRMTPDDKIYVVLPISHIVGISLLFMTFLTGASARLVARYDPARMMEAFAHEGITIVNGVPATYQRLIEHKAVAAIETIKTGRLRLIAVAGAPLDLDLKRKVERDLRLPLLNGYGITECAPGLSGVKLDAPRTDDAVGTLVPGIEARLISPEGTVCADGVVGELHVRGRNVMLGYYRAPDLTAKAIDSDGWFNTGDLGRFEGDVLYIAGRTKELIIRSGFNVYPAEVEAVLSTHPDVVQCAVIGRKVDGNEEVVAFVRLLAASKTTPDDLARHVAPLLTAYKRPSEIIVVDSLPSTSTGKILKHKLAELYRT
jgi:long-chain acyl-CoA synthetase